MENKDIKKAVEVADKATASTAENDWLKNSRSRNTRLETLTEGDIIVIDGNMFKVDSGDIHVYADGTIDQKQGELVMVDIEVFSLASAQGKRILNMEDING